MLICVYNFCSWASPLLPSKKVLGSNPLAGSGLCVKSACCACVCVLSRYSGFLQQSKDMHGARLIGNANWAVGVNANGWNGERFDCNRQATCSHVPSLHPIVFAASKQMC